MGVSNQEMMELAYEHLREGHFEDAVTLFSDSLLLTPREAKTYYGRGSAYFQLRRWDLAIADFEEARKIDAEDPDNFLALAVSLAISNRVYEAIDCYEAILAKNPQLVRAHIQLAMLYYRLGTITKGHRQLDTALSFRPSLSERKTIETLKKEQLSLDKKRFYRADFEALRQMKRNRTSSDGILKKVRSLFK